MAPSVASSRTKLDLGRRSCLATPTAATSTHRAGLRPRLDRLDDLNATAITRPTGPRRGASGTASDDAGSDARDDSELIGASSLAKAPPEMCALAARYIGTGMKPDAVAEVLRGLMMSMPRTSSGRQVAASLRAVTQPHHIRHSEVHRPGRGTPCRRPHYTQRPPCPSVILRN